MRISHLHLRLLFPSNPNQTLIYPLFISNFFYSLLICGAHMSSSILPPRAHPPFPNPSQTAARCGAASPHGCILQGGATPPPRARPSGTAAVARRDPPARPHGRDLRGRALPPPRARRGRTPLVPTAAAPGVGHNNSGPRRPPCVASKAGRSGDMRRSTKYHLLSPNPVLFSLGSYSSSSFSLSLLLSLSLSLSLGRENLWGGGPAVGVTGDESSRRGLQHVRV
jgi:hypothetical protein